MERKFTFWPSFLEGAGQMDSQQRREYIYALVEYGVYGKEPEFTDPLMLTAWPGARESIDSGIRKASGGKIGGSKNKRSAKSPSNSESYLTSYLSSNQTSYEESNSESYVSNTKTIDEDIDVEREPLEGSLSSTETMDEEGIGSGIVEPEPKETYTPRCPNGCTKPDGSPSDMRLDAEAEGLRCSVCGELLEVD